MVLFQRALLPEPRIAPFVFFFFAVALTSWLAGRLPGLLAVVLSAGFANYFFIEPYGAASLSGPRLTATALFLAAASAVALLCGSFREALLDMQRALSEQTKAEEALRESELRFRTLVDAIPQLAWVARADGYIDWYNQRWYQYTGTTPEQMEGWGWQSVHDPEALPKVLDRWKASIASGEPFDMEFPLRGADGGFRRFLTRVRPLKDSEGRVVQWFGTNTDVTDIVDAQAALRESEERFRVMADSSPVIMWVTDREGGSQFVNRTYREFFGVTYEMVQGGKWHPLVHPDDVPAYVGAFLASVKERRSFVAQARVRRADGEWRWIASQAEARFSSQGEFLGHVGASFDITDRKQAEDALREADRRKSEFMAILSHELRNPLAPIRNSLYILDRAAPGGEQAQRAHQVIDRQTAHLTRLVDDLLDVTRISRGKINLQHERLDLCHLVRRTVEDHRSLFLQNGVALEVSVPDHDLRVNGDETRLAQVIGNLLQNAAKFTNNGGTTAVVVEDDAAAGLALIRVRDTGVGMSAEMLPHLFEPFVQADRTLDRSRGGLGLGLALVKGLVELHGGTVDASSAGVGNGAEFTVRLPLDRNAPGARPATDAPRRAPSPKRRVLVIEDNIDAAQSLKEALALSGHDVIVAYSGPEGIAKAREFQPEVVLCDIGLPGMDGYEVARAFRADAALKGVLLVALTGYAAPEDQQRSAEAGFERHLAKPPNLEQLSDVLASAPSTGTASRAV